MKSTLEHQFICASISKGTVEVNDEGSAPTSTMADLSSG